jgi:hypothetical protein
MHVTVPLCKMTWSITPVDLFVVLFIYLLFYLVNVFFMCMYCLMFKDMSHIQMQLINQCRDWISGMNMYVSCGWRGEKFLRNVETDQIYCTV